MTNSRTKGASGEREVAQELHRQLGMNFKRNLDQYREDDLGDLICDNPAFPFIIEVKRYGKGWTCKAAWEAQAFKAAKKAKKHPCVIYRYNNQDWRARVWMDALAESVGGNAVCGVRGDFSLQDFAWVCREIMARRDERLRGIWQEGGE